MSFPIKKKKKKLSVMWFIVTDIIICTEYIVIANAMQKIQEFMVEGENCWMPSTLKMSK